MSANKRGFGGAARSTSTYRGIVISCTVSRTSTSCAAPVFGGRRRWNIRAHQTQKRSHPCRQHVPQTPHHRRSERDSGIRAVVGRGAALCAPILSAGGGDRRRGARYAGGAEQTGGSDPAIPGPVVMDSPQVEDQAGGRAGIVLAWDRPSHFVVGLA